MIGWIKLVDGEGQTLTVMASQIAMIGPHYTEKKFAELKQPSPNMCNIFIGGAFFTIQGSMELVQILVTQALTQQESLVSPINKLQQLPKTKEEN